MGSLAVDSINVAKKEGNIDIHDDSTWKQQKSRREKNKSRNRPRGQTNQDRTLLIALLVLAVVTITQVVMVERFFVSTETPVVSHDIQYIKNTALNGRTEDAGSTTEGGLSGIINRAASASSAASVSILREPVDIVAEVLQRDVPLDVKENLPSREEVVKLYGATPRILGLETCQAFRDTVKQQDAFIAPAGMFNTGTNLIYEYLEQNCNLPDKVRVHGIVSRGMRFQVPWGKHAPASWRLNHFAKDAPKSIDQTAFLPIVAIKDPFTWMQSMCRHGYAAFWPHSKQHCPNLVPMYPYEEQNKFGEVNTDSVKVGLKYDAYSQDRIIYDSLAHLWNEWYAEWLNVTHFPFLVVRFEDLLFHAEAVITEVCHCGGGVMEPFSMRKGKLDDSQGFQYIEDSAKGGQKIHEGSSGFATAITKVGEKIRMEQYTEEDMEFAKKVLRKDIMEVFHYTMPSSL
uniref:Sulfotransferase domain-containing protein n=1 Tax=Ditylum brightwellii TaxID=49249 RepID=A0A7S4RP45_9STRA|mmetsp:Transcript_17953/g.23925  ORF Transcript_17953/g.23925 Transcript_17953/m.23925 type:complete len:457 (-) Transcript_17953:414-1784(-)